MELLPTKEDIKELYFSSLYQNLLQEFETRSNHKLETEEDTAPDLGKYLSFIQRHYLILNLPFTEVLSEFEKLQEPLLQFTIRSIDFFVAQEENTESEAPEEGEELEEGGVSRTFILNKFCEFYLLTLGDKDRLLDYLITSRMPYAEEYMEQIIQLYTMED